MGTQEFALDVDTVRPYLRQQGLIADSTSIKATELGGGISNVVVLVEGQGIRWVVKQSLGKLRVKEDWHSDRNRIFREAQALQVLGELLGPAAVPDVIYVDREHYVFIMSAAPAEAAPWKDLLLRGRVDLAVARQVGTLLARVIKNSHDNPHLRDQFHDRRIFDQLRIGPYYRTVASRDPSVRMVMQDLISDSWNTRISIVHGDYSPKNILVDRNQILLIDCEVVHWGDPAFDAGFLLTHLFLKAIHKPKDARSYLAAALAFWKALERGLGVMATGQFARLTIRHLGGLMLARIDGKSPVEYLVDEKSREQARTIAKRILLGPPSSLSELADSVVKELWVGRMHGSD